MVAGNETEVVRQEASHKAAMRGKRWKTDFMAFRMLSKPPRRAFHAGDNYAPAETRCQSGPRRRIALYPNSPLQGVGPATYPERGRGEGSPSRRAPPLTPTLRKAHRSEAEVPPEGGRRLFPLSEGFFPLPEGEGL